MCDIIIRYLPTKLKRIIRSRHSSFLFTAIIIIVLIIYVLPNNLNNQDKSHRKFNAIGRCINCNEDIVTTTPVETTVELTTLPTTKKPIRHCSVIDPKEQLSFSGEPLKCLKTSGGWFSVVMCTYPDDLDNVISRPINHGSMWEADVTYAILRFMKETENIGFIDIGAHIGVHCLQIASFGFPVIAVEPNLESIRRLHAAVQLNNFSKPFTLLRNAVSSRRGLMHLIDNAHGKDQSMIQTAFDNEPSTGPLIGTANAIVLNDLLEVIDFPKAVIKIDVELHEPYVLADAAQFFREIDVRAVFMEWKFRRMFGVEFNRSPLYNALVKMKEFLLAFGFHPYGAGGTKRMFSNGWENWPSDIVWVMDNNDHLPL